MALYNYQAVSKTGKKISGQIDASTLQNARDLLSKQGFFPIKVDLSVTAAKDPWYRKLFRRGVSLKDEIFFTKQLGVLLRSGIPLVESLELLVEQTLGPLKNIIISLRDGIKEGRSLADGLARYPDTFDTIYIQLVRAGEATGNLEGILERLTDFLQRRDELRKKIAGALRYPLIQLSVIS